MYLQRVATGENTAWQTPWVKVSGHILTCKFQGFGMEITMCNFSMSSLEGWAGGSACRAPPAATDENMSTKT